MSEKRTFSFKTPAVCWNRGALCPDEGIFWQGLGVKDNWSISSDSLWHSLHFPATSLRLSKVEIVLVAETNPGLIFSVSDGYCGLGNKVIMSSIIPVSLGGVSFNDFLQDPLTWFKNKL